jgi:ornithine cyclodeaminase/alanine dehydrogenase
VLCLTAEDIADIGLTTTECLVIARQALLDLASGLAEVPTKVGVHPPEGRHVHAMPAYLSRTGALGLKWIADFPGNEGCGLPTLSAILILNDPCTGAPVSLMDGAAITAMRTAAMTGVSLEACARADSRVAAIIGTGVQARALSKTLPVALPELRRVRVAGRVREDAERFCRQAGNGLFVPVERREDAVRGADVVVTVTNAVGTRLLEPEWLEPGVTVVVLDNGGKETGILGCMDRVVCDGRDAFATAEVAGRFPTGVPHLDAEIGEVLAGRCPGRTDDRERILILNLGTAAADIAVAFEVYRLAQVRGAGSILSL